MNSKDALRQHIEDHADRSSRLRRDTVESTDENLTREHQREPSAVENWHGLAGWP
jgi:hypothetical protein